MGEEAREARPRGRPRTGPGPSWAARRAPAGRARVLPAPIPGIALLERAAGRPAARTLVTGFGIARHADGEAALADPAARLTQSGQVPGTRHYMSPEQVGGAPLDGRSDLYALGVVAFQTLSGRLPFEGLSATAVLVAHVPGRVHPSARPPVAPTAY